MSYQSFLSKRGGKQPIRLLVPLLGVIFATSGPLEAKPRAGSAEAELLVVEEAYDRVSMRLNRKKDELAMYQEYQKTAAEVEKLTAVLASEKEKLAALNVRKLEVADEVAALQVAFEDYRDQYRKSEREAAKGEILDLSETKGETYKESKILGISPLHLRVSRPTGAEGIPFADLPREIQDRFQFSIEEANEYGMRLAKSDAARAQQFAQWKESQTKDPVLSSSNLAKRLEATQKLADEKRAESQKYKDESDAMRNTAARLWKGVSKATSASGRNIREKSASRVEVKADDLLDLSKSARMQAIDLDGEVRKIQELIDKQTEK